MLAGWQKHTSTQNDFLLDKKDSARLKPSLSCLCIPGRDVSTNTANFTLRKRLGRNPSAVTPPGWNVASFQAVESGMSHHSISEGPRISPRLFNLEKEKQYKLKALFFSRTIPIQTHRHLSLIQTPSFLIQTLSNTGTPLQ